MAWQLTAQGAGARGGGLRRGLERSPDLLRILPEQGLRGPQEERGGPAHLAANHALG
jgi:hypothetical protein